MQADIKIGYLAVDLSEIYSAVCRELRGALCEQHSRLADQNGLDPALATQVQLVLNDVVDMLPSGGDPDSESTADRMTGLDRQLCIEIGAHRADREIHPVESLRAATMLFEVALPILLRGLPESGGTTPVEVSKALHEAVMSRVADASLAYVSFLLEKLRGSRQEERRRIARELHDRVLHSLAFAVHQIDLHRYRAATEHSCSELDAALAQVLEAVHTVQCLSAELRRSVSDDGLERSLRSYLQVHAEPAVRVVFGTAGDVFDLPAVISEELYLTLREAVRNALRHAEPSTLTVNLDINASGVVASVVDDGCGFDGCAPPAEGGGMASMRERVRLLHGEIDVTSSPGVGTAVTVRVPLCWVEP